MKINNRNKRKKQRGFALIEVMIAALVLVVGGVGFMKLQQLGLQYGFNNTARSQGVALATGFIEQLRSNVNYLRTQGLSANSGTGTPVSGSFRAGAVSKPTNATSCLSNTQKTTCATRIFDLHTYLTSQQMSNITAPNNSVLCFVESGTHAGLVRVTFKWLDNTTAGQSVNLDQCPAFNDNLNQNNSVTVYAQL